MNKDILINSCIEEAFKRHSIKHIRCRNDWSLSPSESIINIKGNEIKIVSAHEIQDQMRLNFALSLIDTVIKTFNLNLNCNIILAVSDATPSSQKYTRLTFAYEKESNHIPIPDPHIFKYIYYINNILKNDSSFETKNNKICFFGSDTGRIEDDLLCQRIRFCNIAQKRPHIEAKITNFVHFNREMLKDLGINKEEISSEFVPIENQINNKYILNIDGHSSSWDRTPWAMASNSYLIHLKSNTNCPNTWYHPFILKENILKEYTEKDILNFNLKYDENTKSKQKKFANLILEKDTHIVYLKKTLIKYNIEYNS